jgi:hypothetical protein
MWRLGWLLVLGCGRIGFGGTADAGDGGGGIVDAPPADACMLSAWGPPTMITELTTMFDERDPTIRTDNLELIFVRASATDPGDLYTARRPSPSAPFDNVHALTALNTAGTKDDGPSISSDGLTLYWKSEVGGVIQLWYSTRASIDVDFANPQVLPGGPFTERASPSISADNLELFQCSTMGHLYVAQRQSTTEYFGITQLIGSPIDSTNYLESPYISRDGTTLYYVEYLANIYTIRESTRAGSGSPFGTPITFPPLAGGVGDWEPELSADTKTLYFYRYNAGQADLLTIHRDCL